jgi:hypothetical protein
LRFCRKGFELGRTFHKLFDFTHLRLKSGRNE